MAHVKSLKSNLDLIMSIMDTLDIILDILLKPPQPLMGLFLHCVAKSNHLGSSDESSTKTIAWEQQTLGCDIHLPTCCKFYPTLCWDLFSILSQFWSDCSHTLNVNASQIFYLKGQQQRQQQHQQHQQYGEHGNIQLHGKKQLHGRDQLYRHLHLKVSFWFTYYSSI